jgi:CheY-like chemotaxis protein
MATATDRRHVLIVDDHEPTRLLVGHIVAQELGARVTLAGTGEEALRLAEQETYDVILLDLLMPGIGGFEVLRRIRAGGVNRRTPVLVLSPSSSSRAASRTPPSACARRVAARYVMRAQARPGREAAALGARGRARVPRDQGAGRHRRAGPAMPTRCARTSRSSAAPSTSWTASRAACSGTRRCRA